MNVKKMCVSLLGVAALALSLGSVARAQDSAPKMQAFAGYSFSTNNCFGSCFFDPAVHGYAAAFTYNFNRHIGLEANFSGHNGTSTLENFTATTTSNGFLDKANQNIYVYTFGPRLSVPVGNFSLFTHVLVGAAHIDVNSTNQCSPEIGNPGACGTPALTTAKILGNGFASKFGGGVDWNHGRWGIRILEADYVHGQIYTTQTCSNCNGEVLNIDNSGSAFELSTGVTVNFGGMR